MKGNTSQFFFTILSDQIVQHTVFVTTALLTQHVYLLLNHILFPNLTYTCLLPKGNHRVWSETQVCAVTVMQLAWLHSIQTTSLRVCCWWIHSFIKKNTSHQKLPWPLSFPTKPIYYAGTNFSVSSVLSDQKSVGFAINKNPSDHNSIEKIVRSSINMHKK